MPPLFPPFTEAGIAWFSIDYRLAPAHKFPAPIDDVRAAFAYVTQHSKEFKVDPKRIGLVGESAGATIAACGNREREVQAEGGGGSIWCRRFGI